MAAEDEQGDKSQLWNESSLSLRERVHGCVCVFEMDITTGQIHRAENRDIERGGK